MDRPFQHPYDEHRDDNRRQQAKNGGEVGPDTVPSQQTEENDEWECRRRR